MLPLFSLEEKDKAVEELAKLVERDVPDNMKNKELVRSLVAQGLSEERAVQLADWAIQWHEKSTRLTPKEEVVWFSNIAKERLEEGISKEQVAEELTQLGLSESDANRLVDEVIRAREPKEMPEPDVIPEERMTLAGKYARQMWYGVLWVLAGMLAAVIATTLDSLELRVWIYLAAGITIVIGLANFVSGYRWLLKCKSGNISESIKEENKEFACPVCGQDIEMGQPSCPRCGSEIDWGD